MVRTEEDDGDGEKEDDEDRQTRLGKLGPQDSYLCSSSNDKSCWLFAASVELQSHCYCPQTYCEHFRLRLQFGIGMALSDRCCSNELVLSLLFLV